MKIIISTSDVSKKSSDKSFVVTNALGKQSTFTKFADGLAALGKSSLAFGPGTTGFRKPCTLTQVTQEGEELLAKKYQNPGADKPMSKISFTKKGMSLKNAAGI